MQSSRSRHAAESVGLFAVLAGIWGLSFPFVTIALESLGPWMIAGSRALLGLVLLLCWRPRLAVRALRLIRARPLGTFVLAALQVTLPFLLLSLAQRHVAPGAMAVIISASPALVALAAPFVDHSERLRGIQWVGVAVAIAGVAITSGATPDGVRSLGGLVLAIACACAYAASALFTKVRFREDDRLDLVIVIMALGSAQLLVPMLLDLPAQAPSLASVAALAELTLVGSLSSFALLFVAIRRRGAGFALRPLCFSPVVAILASALLLGEPLAAGLAVGFAVTVVGTLLGADRRSDDVDDAEVAQHVEGVPRGPVLDDPAVAEAADDDPRGGDRGPGRGEAHELPLVRAGGLPAGDDTVALGDEVDDRGVEVREG